LRRLCLSACLGLAPALAVPAAPATPAPAATKAPAAPAPAAAKTPAAPAPAAAKAPAAPAPAAAKAAEPESIYAHVTRDGAAVKVPLFADGSQKTVIAKVEESDITLGELTAALAAAHDEMDDDATRGGKKDFGPILDRMIEVRLIAAEAREMGLDELPETKQALADFKAVTGRELLKARVIANVQPDPAEVERLYRSAVREWKVKSVLFSGELDAKQYGPKLKAAPAFDAVAKQLVADKKAKGGGDAQVLPRSQMLPQVLAALEKLKAGQVSAPVRVQEGFAVLKVEEIRYPDDPKARAEARNASLTNRREKALKDYYAGLIKRYAKIDKALLKSLNYDAKKPGVEALKKDKRVLADIEGGKPITVGEFTEAIVAGFYHGVDAAIKEKKVNKQKESVFDGMLSKRILPLQVRADRLEETPEYARRVADYEMGLLFSRFIEKAILPKLDLSDAQVKKYYAEHKREFMYPTFYKVESLAFAKVGDAEAAVKKLRSGTDFKWLNANAEGQIKPADRKLAIEGTLAATALPKEIATVLAGTKKDDYRLHAGPDSQFYAIHVIDVIGATEQPFDEVREQITQKLYNDGITRDVRKWSDTLRKAREVKVFLTRIGS
jgi:parvulin-like peptidyl-prolyl isomerase